jgi:hypothetical protein
VALAVLKDVLGGVCVDFLFAVSPAVAAEVVVPVFGGGWGVGGAVEFVAPDEFPGGLLGLGGREGG